MDKYGRNWKQKAKEQGYKQYKDLDLRAIREACDLDFAHYTYKPGMCSCCYNPKDLASLYWRKRTIPNDKEAYDGFRRKSDAVMDDEYTYLLFKNADNGSGHVTAEGFIEDYTCVEWGFPMDRMGKVCSMLQEQLGDRYILEIPETHMKTIVIRVRKDEEND